MSWGSDIRHYPTLPAMRAELPTSLARGAPRVLKQIRGQSGNGVWKVELAAPCATSTSAPSLDAAVRIQHAKRGSIEEIMALDQFIAQCKPYFIGQGGMIDQAYVARLSAGMVRCYMVRDRVAGFGEQLVNALYPPRLACPRTRRRCPGLASTTRRHGKISNC